LLLLLLLLLVSNLTQALPAAAAAAHKAVLLQQLLLPQLRWLLSKLGSVADCELLSCCCSAHTHQQQLPAIKPEAVIHSGLTRESELH
jgi:hypothetical protein